MGMAASQARYLALLARKSNCEYEGQQINQSRLALSNQSADLFNQMMGLVVPSTPSKSDYTVQKYTFSDGMNAYTIDKWNRLSDSEGDGYNYSITYHYESDRYTGFQKFRLNPQVQFSGATPTSSTDAEEQIRLIQAALVNRDAKKAAMDLAYETYATQLKQAGKKSNYLDSSTVSGITACTSDATSYTITCGTGTDAKVYTYTNYDSLTDEEKQTIKENVDKLIEYGAFDGDVKDFDYSTLYYCKDNGQNSIAFSSDLKAIKDSSGTIVSTRLPIYHVTGEAPVGASYVTMEQMINLVNSAYNSYIVAQSEYKTAEAELEKCDMPIKIGTIKLTPLSSMNENQLAAVTQIIADMKENDIDCNVKNCFDTYQEEYTNDTYKGGIYTFEMVGKTYYVTYYDLLNSILNGTGVNSIDDQAKLPYYGAQDMETPIVKTSRALIDKDQSGRFVTMQIEDDSLVYELKSTSETDEVAYEDAMNEYTYQRALYDKQVSDINAKTSIIQRQDQNLELRLKQLDTEQNALNTEIEAVSKVVKDNIEKSFKTFSG